MYNHNDRAVVVSTVISFRQLGNRSVGVVIRIEFFADKTDSLLLFVKNLDFRANVRYVLRRRLSRISGTECHWY